MRASRWPASVAVGLLFTFMGLLPEHYPFLPHGARLSTLALVAAFAVLASLSHLGPRMRRVANLATVALVLVLTAMLVTGIVTVIVHIYEKGMKVRGVPVLSTTAALWATNIVVFALWYWLVDRGGPDRRASRDPAPFDLLFPQNTGAGAPRSDWTPGFVDYFFVAFVTSTAFSPADTLPLTMRAKLLVMAQAVLSLVTVVIMAGRAINVLE
jgi:hypothetical protein